MGKVIEFFEMEAEREGRDPVELMEEFWNDLAEDERKEVERLKREALDVLNGAIKEWNECVEEWGTVPAPEVKDVIEAVHATVDYGPGGWSMSLSAKVRLVDGSLEYVYWGSYHDAGSWEQPPDDDVEVAIGGVHKSVVVLDGKQLVISGPDAIKITAGGELWEWQGNIWRVTDYSRSAYRILGDVTL